MEFKLCYPPFTSIINLNILFSILVIVIISLQLGESQEVSTIKNNNNDNGNHHNTSNSSSLHPENSRLLQFPPFNGNIYTCPEQCRCVYESTSKKLTIKCGDGGRDDVRLPFNPQETLPQASMSSLDLSDGVRHLIIENATLISTTIPKFFPELENYVNLVNLEIHDSLLDPILILNSKFIQLAERSLQNVEIINAKIHPSYTSSITSLSTTSNGQRVLGYFAGLKNLNSLTMIISDRSSSSSKLANLIVQSLPVASHITIVNSLVSELNPDNFAHLSSSLKTLKLGSNNINTIPARFLENFPNLQTLDLSHNSIEHLQEEVFVGLDSLRILNVSKNNIRYIDTEVFNPLKKVQTIDMSHNNVIQIFEPYFENNHQLKTLHMQNAWTDETFMNPDTSATSQLEMERLINTLQFVEYFDLSDNKMTIIPETLTHIPLTKVQLHGNQWSCSCEDRWVLAWLDTTKVIIGDNNNNTSDLWCYSDETGSRFHAPLVNYVKSLRCPQPNIYRKYRNKYFTRIGLTTLLRGHRQGKEWPIITWITPDKQRLTSTTYNNHDDNINTEGLNNNNSASTTTYPPHSSAYRLQVLDNGTLHIVNVTKSDFGLYLCIAQYQNLNITHYVHLGMDTTIFSGVRLMSVLVGWAASFAFLLCVIITHFVRCLLRKCGIESISVSNTKQARRVRAFFDSMEQHKTSQLDWLRDNYLMQAGKIKDNCTSQLERIRESYAAQYKNLTDIKEYGANQFHQLRDQYYDQVRKVSGYSTQQLCRVRENYVFQRNRVCKFSSHQLLKFRETYKWQAQTLNKILENLPRTLNLDTCRGIGTCGRTDSIYLEDISEFQSIDESSFPPNNMEPNNFSCEKMEHISLLIPPEFMATPFNIVVAQSQASSSTNIPPQADDACIIEAEQHDESSSSSDTEYLDATEVVIR